MIRRRNAGRTASNQEARNSSIELLRIIAMVMIVAHHFAYHGGFQFSNDTFSLNRLWLQFILLGGKIGVDIFVLISGYFLIYAEKIKTNKALKLWLQIFSTSAVIFCVCAACKIQPFSVKGLIGALLPVTFDRWWFASAYFVLYLLSPFINRLLLHLSKKAYQGFLALLTVLWCVIPTFTGRGPQMNHLCWFVYLYALSGYIRIFGVRADVKPSTYILLSLALAALTFLSAVVFDVIGLKYKVFSDHSTFFYSRNKLPILLSALLLFIGFTKLEVKSNKAVNAIASTTFGVYLIHDHAVVRSFLWETVFRNASFQNSNVLIPYSIAVIIAVFVGCALIEAARKKAERLFEKSIDRSASRIDQAIGGILTGKLLDRL